jgi:hypothetical protein
VPGSGVYFGNDMYRTLKIFKYEDANNNGIYDQNEIPLAGREFQIGDNSVFTDNNGTATFKVKANNEYVVSESIQPGWINTTPREVGVLIDPVQDLTEARLGIAELRSHHHKRTHS